MIKHLPKLTKKQTTKLLDDLNKVKITDAEYNKLLEEASNFINNNLVVSNTKK